ncbi:MAG: flagellar basal-body MS-ring/collar protein FliF [Planctomycetota bacterium]
MGGLQQFTQQLQQFWSRQGTAGRVVYGGVTLALMVLVGGVSYWASQTEYSVLFSGLPAEDADAIVQKLEADRTSYQLTSGGSTILVPADKVHQARMTLVAAGLPQGSGKGFELFDQMSMGATPFVQNLNYVRAIQGELARTIMTLEPVAHARVHIVQPEPTPFVREEKPVTASVVIKTRAGAALSRRATAGIVALVAGSVKGLTAENVTVLDSDGQVLSEKRDAKGGSASSDQLAYQRDVESHLASKAQEILSRLLGHGRAVVRVTADMSFRHLKETTEKFDPEGKVVTRELLTSSKTTSATGTRGPAGAVSNIPPGQPVGPSGAAPNKNDETIENEYAVSRTNRQLEEQQGTIDRLTVAVMLIPSPTDANTPPEETLGITPAEAKELVKQAVGYKEGRDQIQVSIGKVAEAPAEAALDAGILALQQWQNYATIVRASSGGVVAFLLFAIGIVALRRLPAPRTAPNRPAIA